ncbi:MAG: hypothetical protein ATN31_06345 [Candidatus Epulonipiscioides saccharophilum]|nr:MAG: hypothetical protein ATN31_06345 [Epulopiscium sp. AS2M-Bin001]
MIYSFNQSVQGYHHKLKNKPMQDYSASHREDNHEYYIAIVADGHGSEECLRSDIGSRIVTEIATEYLIKFAEFILESEANYSDLLNTSLKRYNPIYALKSSIVSTWYDRVEIDYKQNPIKSSSINIFSLYGTTLIAALRIKNCLLLLQQGDGDCIVMYDNGTIDCPIPPDEKCIENVTTSMCDQDADVRMRCSIINLQAQNILGCFLGTDGVSDTYLDSSQDLGGLHYRLGGVHAFYKDLCLKILQPYFDLHAYLEDFSKYGRFSKAGSGDDVSVASILDIELINQAKFESDIYIYSLEERLFWINDELRSKSRKYNMLKAAYNKDKKQFFKKLYVNRNTVNKHKFNFFKNFVPNKNRSAIKKIADVGHFRDISMPSQKEVTQQQFLDYKKLFDNLRQEQLSLQGQLDQYYSSENSI